MTEKQDHLVCNKCQVELTLSKATFRYLNRSFEHEVLRCPECGQVYLPEELIQEKMLKVEAALEEK
ncbi:MAG: hypothetical protein RSD88_01560 [Anaerovoracaceae bacterium]